VNSSTVYSATLRENLTSISLQSSAVEDFTSLDTKPPHLDAHKVKSQYTFFYQMKNQKKNPNQNVAKVPSAAADPARLATEAASPLRLAGDAVSGNYLCASETGGQKKKHG